MAEGLFTLILFSIAMAVASFGAGMLPIYLSLTKAQMRLISTVGMGVLVGTSLIVIIPEGIDALYSANSPPHHDDNPRIRRDDHEDESSPHAYIGLSLITGFILMYLIDTLPPLIHRSSHPPQPSYITLNALTPPAHSPSAEPHPQFSSPFSTTTGLVIHSLADGIALGASSTSSNVSLELIIFLAILLHKAPAAFSLSAILLQKRLSKRSARAHLAIFSLAAPVGALATWTVVTIAGGVGVEVGNRGHMDWWTGVLLLFSGGTFLYVAMHTMQDISHDSGHGDEDSERMGMEEGGYMMSSPGVRKQARSGPSVSDTVAAVVGMLVPLVTQLGHGHGH